MKLSNSSAFASTRAVPILSLVALLMGCTVEAKGTGDAGPPGAVGATGPAGPQGTPGVPCAGCVDSASIGAGAVTAPAIGAGAVTAPKLAAGAVTAPAIAAGAVGSAALALGAVGSLSLADGAVTSAKLSAGAVDSTALAANAVGTGQLADLSITTAKFAPGAVDSSALGPGAVTSAKIASGTITGGATGNIAGATITGANIATGTITGTHIANNSITGADIDTTTTITATDFVYTAPVAGSYFANPLECQRGLSVAAPYQDMQAVHPPGNPIGPSIIISNLAAGTYEMFCPVNLQAPLGATLTITGADLLFFDAASNCLIGAQLRTKVLGAQSNGTIVATQFDGTSGSDFAFAGGPALKAFPAFTPFTVTSSTLFWVNAFIQLAAAATFPETNCRYSGVRVTYTLDRP